MDQIPVAQAAGVENGLLSGLDEKEDPALLYGCAPEIVEVVRFWKSRNSMELAYLSEV